MSQRILLIGASGHARVIADIITTSGSTVVGALSDRAADRESFAYPILGSPSAIATLSREQHVDAVIVAIGDNWQRHKVVRLLMQRLPEIRFGTAVHPAAVIAKDVVVGEGSVVMAGVVVNPGCTIGAHAILNTSSSVDHDCSLAEFSSVAPGAAIGGNVNIGTRTSIGIGASIIHGVSIGDDVVVGAGASVVTDLLARAVALGVPARVVRERAVDEPYL
jgi:sugar O-acyltransferase (sialic acid O-acetyltransferase NeuD family)